MQFSPAFDFLEIFNYIFIFFRKDPDWITTTFDDTLPMSSYLLALVVSDFQYVEGYTTKHTRVSSPVS